MGNGTSVAANVNTQTDLIKRIYAIAAELSESYNIKYLDPRFCNSLAIIYNDKLMNYRKQDLLGVSASLGLVVDKPNMKQQICDSIIKHYTDRLNLIAVIQKSTSYCSDRVYALSSGPVCTGNPEVFDQVECVKSGSRWEPFVVAPDEKIEENRTWYNYLNHMQDMYVKSLARLYDILQQLKNFDQEITDEKLQTISGEVKNLIENMSANCAQMYKLALTTPTYTKEELLKLKENQVISQNEQQARSAALRAARGLPPVQAGGAKAKVKEAKPKAKKPKVKEAKPKAKAKKPTPKKKKGPLRFVKLTSW
jgi:hypothetical protein